MSRQEDAKKLLGLEKPAFLITTDEDGRPDARAMAVMETEGLKILWMMTCKESDKYRQLSKNPQCMIYATEMEDNVNYLELRLWGRVELPDNAETKNRLWRDDYLPYFPGGKEDPNLGLLKFVTEAGSVQTPTGKEKLDL
jgi:Uncharacterized stress protein (general stress protein 26)